MTTSRIMNSRSDNLATKDYFKFFIAYYPDFPAETALKGSEAIETLINRVEMTTTVDPMRRHWLTLCKRELKIAAGSNNDGDIARAKRALKNACEYFEDFVAGRQISVDFVVGPNGTTSKT